MTEQEKKNAWASLEKAAKVTCEFETTACEGE